MDNWDTKEATAKALADVAAEGPFRRLGGTPTPLPHPPAVSAISPLAQDRERSLLHQLSDRLTAAGCYLKALQHGPGTLGSPVRFQSGEILERAMSQLDDACDLVHCLRDALRRSLPPDTTGWSDPSAS